VRADAVADGTRAERSSSKTQLNLECYCACRRHQRCHL